MPTKIIPCSKALTCEWSDNPLRNISAETPDVPFETVLVFQGRTQNMGDQSGRFNGVWRGIGATLIEAIENGQQQATRELVCVPQATDSEPVFELYDPTIGPDNPNEPRDKTSSDVPDVPGSPGHPATLPTPPFEADASTLVGNNAQTCSIDDCNGTALTVTIAADTLFSCTQALADAAALQQACDQVTALCGAIVGPGGDIPTTNPPSTPEGPPTPQLYWNTLQTCYVSCPNGSQAINSIAANTYLAESLATANAMALSYACNNVAEFAFCLEDLTSPAQMGVAYSDTVAVPGIVFTACVVTAGALPTGLTLATDGTVSGVPLAVSTYGFTILATSDRGIQSQRSYTIVVESVASGDIILAEDNSGLLLEDGGYILLE